MTPETLKQLERKQNSRSERKKQKQTDKKKNKYNIKF